MMKRLVVDLCEVLLAGGAVGTFFVVVSDKPLAESEAVFSKDLRTLRMLFDFR